MVESRLLQFFSGAVDPTLNRRFAYLSHNNTSIYIALITLSASSVFGQYPRASPRLKGRSIPKNAISGSRKARSYCACC
jgi:hypothetical protein